MNFVKMAFKCERCGAELEAHVAAATGYGMGGHQAECPKCGTVQGNCPDKVIRVVEVKRDGS
jgi:DNA-directed RNA polymerase subunit RPC12/RpoP